LTAGTGNVFAQNFTTPSQLGYPYYGQPSPAMARYMQPMPKALPMDSAEPADSTPTPAPMPNGTYNGTYNGTHHGAHHGAPGTSCHGCNGHNGCGPVVDSYEGYPCEICYERPTWFGTVAGLYMTRDCPDEKQIAFDPLSVDREYLGTQMVCPDDWQGGFELRFGRYLGCRCRVEAVYWTLDEDQRSASRAGPIDSALDFNRLDFGALGGANAWFDDADFQQISMRSEFDNWEGNLWVDCCCGPCSPLQISWLAGFRFFRFEEGFSYASADQAPALGVSPADDAYYDVNVENFMAGIQLGCRAQYKVGRSLGFFAEPRVGIFWNHIEHEQRLATGSGVVAVDPAGRPFLINSEKDDFAAIGQLDVGLSYDIGCHLTLYTGYRLVAASGVALATDQIPQYMSDLTGIENVDNNGHVFLHGVQVGLSWRF
jgi:hypothetical protein